jgi:hypothetical protein
MADIAMLAAAPVGAALTFIALLTGSIWGKPTWGTWWVWDARITSMLILLFLYLGVIALYEAYDNKAAAAPGPARCWRWWARSIFPSSTSLWTGGTACISRHRSSSPVRARSIRACSIRCCCASCPSTLLFTCALLANMRVAILRRERRTAWVRRLAAERVQLMYFESCRSGTGHERARCLCVVRLRDLRCIGPDAMLMLRPCAGSGACCANCAVKRAQRRCADADPTGRPEACILCEDSDCGWC